MIDIGEEGPLKVSKLKLYKFDREERAVEAAANSKPESMDLVPYEGPEVGNCTQDGASALPATLKEAEKEVAEALREIWKLPKSDRSSAIKRLIRRWHPDKNRLRESFASDVTKFVVDEVERLKSGGRPGYQVHNSNQTSRGSSRSRSTWNGPDFSEYFHRYEERARRQRQSRHERQHKSKDEAEPPNRNKAERWMRQAQEDFNVATYIFQSEQDTYYSFTCFHCQQAVEKALKALMFARGGIHTNDLETHDVIRFAYCASSLDQRLHVIPDMVKDIHGYYGRCRYPDFYEDSIPAEMFAQEDARDALSKAEECLHLLRQVMD